MKNKKENKERRKAGELQAVFVQILWGHRWHTIGQWRENTMPRVELEAKCAEYGLNGGHLNGQQHNVQVSINGCKIPYLVEWLDEQNPDPIEHKSTRVITCWIDPTKANKPQFTQDGNGENRS